MNAVPRYEILGDTDPVLRAHVWPRYDWGPEEYRRGWPWYCPPERHYNPAEAYVEQRYNDLRRRITETLRVLMSARGLTPIQGREGHRPS